MANKQKVYFLGVKGQGMAPLAVYAKEKGYLVSGSDVEKDFSTADLLKQAGIEPLVFNPQNIKKFQPDIIVVSAAYGADNPELKFAQKQKKIKIISYSEFIKEEAMDKDLIAIAGIHGKTTITALLAFILTEAGLDPSYLVGVAKINDLSPPGHYGQGRYFIIEADEYRQSQTNHQPKFWDFRPKIAVISSIELDHPDIYPDEKTIGNAFHKFASQIKRDG
ncbi:MAG: UDP-N-acetylmuramate: L-alanyl-gamma-D-glutamyl-meso-diaminopimelate ligase, partial [Candidatus Berkelbacteria bacterium Licking1014_2]